MIVDGKIGFTKDDLDMKEFIEDKGLDHVIVVNKIDKLSNNQLMNNKHRLFKDLTNVIYVSALKKKNIEQLKQLILESVK